MKKISVFALCTIAFLLILTAIVLKGGIYKIVENDYLSDFYVVNRFTGRTFIIKDGYHMEVKHLSLTSGQRQQLRDWTADQLEAGATGKETYKLLKKKGVDPLEVDERFIKFKE